MGVMCTNLANELGHYLVEGWGYYQHCCSQKNPHWSPHFSSGISPAFSWNNLHKPHVHMRSSGAWRHGDWLLDDPDLLVVNGS
jgi:hypothetical protein